MTRLSRRATSLFLATLLPLGALLVPAQQSDPKPDPVKAGAELFGKSGCTFCHGPAGLGTERAPSLREVRKRKSDEEIRHQIHDGGQMMPPFGDALTPDEIASLSEFLRAKDAWKLIPSSTPAK